MAAGHHHRLVDIIDSDTEAVKLLVLTATKDPQRWYLVVGRLRTDRETQVAFDAAVAN